MARFSSSKDNFRRTSVGGSPEPDIVNDLDFLALTPDSGSCCGHFEIAYGSVDTVHFVGLRVSDG